MSHGTEHHLEEAEHAQHAVHDPFNRQVAMTMAVVAALLACLTLISHRAHNETFNQMLISSKHANETHNQWARYQAKVIRSYQYEGLGEALPLLAPNPKKPGAEEKTEALARKMNQKVIDWRHDNEDIEKEARKQEAKSQEAEEASKRAHHQSEYFDAGELGAQLALVLCSVAILARRRSFWYAGIIIGAISLVVALGGFVPHSSHDSQEKHEEHALVAPRGPADRCG
jgi:hypothetical protein